MVPEQPTTESCTTVGFRRQLQSRKGGVVSATVTVVLRCGVLVQSFTRCQVRVMILWHEPLVTVLTTVITTPLLGVPAAGTQAFLPVGALMLQFVPHSTVLFDE